MSWYGAKPRFTRDEVRKIRAGLHRCRWCEYKVAVHGASVLLVCPRCCGDRRLLEWDALMHGDSGGNPLRGWPAPPNPRLP